MQQHHLMKQFHLYQYYDSVFSLLLLVLTYPPRHYCNGLKKLKAHDYTLINYLSGDENITAQNNLFYTSLKKLLLLK